MLIDGDDASDSMLVELTIERMEARVLVSDDRRSTRSWSASDASHPITARSRSTDMVDSAMMSRSPIECAASV